MKKNKSKEINKIAIIGHFGGKKVLLDGQTVKTKILYQELSSSTNWKIKKIDTYYKSRRPIKLFFDTMIGLLFYKKIIILLSGNGMKFYFPLLYFFSKYFNKDIYHDVIGGNLHIYVKNNSKYVKYLNSFKWNWVETSILKKELISLGVNNCDVIPNFKNLSIEKNLKKKKSSKVFKLCTFSRVMKEKGITKAIESTIELNKQGKYKFSLDVYGPLDDKYRDEFNDLVNENQQCVKYCGSVGYKDSVNVLKKYDLLLFPTYWDGEGFPGTIVDAFSAGLPVVASDWNCNKEIIKNYIDGIVYPNNNEKDLSSAILRICDDNKLFNDMRFNVIKTARKYMPTEHINKIISYINN